MSTFPARLLNDGEQVVVSTRTHWKALLPSAFFVVAALALLVTSFPVAREGQLEDVDDLYAMTALGWLLRIGALVAVLAAVPRVVSWWTTTYTFTTRRFIKRSGFIAKEGRTIPLNRISGVDFEVGVIDRLFRCGTLVVSDASTGGRVELTDIPDVERVQLQVAAELHRLGGDDGA